MNLAVIPSGEDLIELVSSQLKGREKDFSNNLVVFPGKRPAHFLRRSLARKVGSSLIPPDILSIDEFIDSLCEEKAQLNKIETIDAVALLYEIHKNSQNKIGASGFVSLDSFFPLGLTIYHDLEELMIEEVTSDKLNTVEVIIEEGVPNCTKERLHSLTFFYEEFYRNVESLGFCTRSMRYGLAFDRLHQAELDRFNHIIFAGFFALTAIEKKIFKFLLSRDNTLFMFQNGLGLAERLQDLGIQIEPAERSFSSSKVFFYSSPDAHGEVLALGNELFNRLKSGVSQPDSTLIVLPSSETLFPLVRHGLSNLSEESYNVSLGYPLFRTPVFGFLTCLNELVASMDGEKIYIPDYLKFVLHPYTKNIYFKGKSEITRILFHTIEVELLKNRSQTFTTISQIEENMTVFRNILINLSGVERELTEKDLREHLELIHKMTIVKFYSFKNISDFARKGIELLVFIFNNSSARLHPLFLPFSDSLINAFEVLSRSLMKDYSFNDKSSYFTFLRKYIGTCYTPFPGTPLKGLQVLGALETRNLKFKSVFVLDANEEIFPETKKDDSLIPFRARQVLSLPTYIDREKLTAYYFDLLLAGAEDAHIFFIENNKEEKSRFVEKLLWEKQKRDKTTDTRKYIQTVQYRVNLANKMPDPVSKSQEVMAFLNDYTFNATALDRYLKCPLKFYYGEILNLRPKEEISGNIERNVVGKFIHQILTDYFSERKRRLLGETDASQREMEKLIELLFLKHFGDDPTGALFLLKRQVKKHLIDFIDHYTVPLVKNNHVTILACEEKIAIKFSSFKLMGRIDRIEKRNDKIVIVDYKTGYNPAHLKIDLERYKLENRDQWNRAIGSLQLPFYILLYSEHERKRIEDLEAVYLLLGRSKIGPEIELPLFNGSRAAEVFDPLKTVILKLLQEITDPAVPFLPTNDKKKMCPGCEFQTFCGTQWILK